MLQNTAARQPTYWERFKNWVGGKGALDKAASQGAPPAPKVTPAQDTTYLKQQIEIGEARRKAREAQQLHPAAAKVLMAPPKKKK